MRGEARYVGSQKAFAIEASPGTPVMTPAAGIVEELTGGPGSWELLVRFFNVPLAEGYLLLRGLGAVRVEEGEPVARGEVLGYVGEGTSGAMVRLEWEGAAARAPVMGSAGAAIAGALAAALLPRGRGRNGRRI